MSNLTRDDTIRMAQEAGLAFDSEEFPEIWQTYMDVGREQIERFAALVAAAEREVCLKICDEVAKRYRDAGRDDETTALQDAAFLICPQRNDESAIWRAVHDPRG